MGRKIDPHFEPFELLAALEKLQRKGYSPTGKPLEAENFANIRMLINALKAEAKERNIERKSDKLVRLFIAGEVELALRELETCTEEQAVEAMSGAIETLKEIEMSGEWPEGALLTDEDHSDILETLTLMVDPRWPFAGKRNRR